MIRSSSAPRGVAAAAMAVLALTVGLSAAAPAQADNGDTGPGCGVVCGLLPGDQKTPPTGPGTGKPTEPPSATPLLHHRPPAPAAGAHGPARSGRTGSRSGSYRRPGAHGFCQLQETPTPEATTSAASPSAASASPSAASNWDTPVTKSAKPTQAAAVSRNDGSGLLWRPRAAARHGGRAAGGSRRPGVRLVGPEPALLALTRFFAVPALGADGEWCMGSGAHRRVSGAGIGLGQWIFRMSRGPLGMPIWIGSN